MEGLFVVKPYFISFNVDNPVGDWLGGWVAIVNNNATLSAQPLGFGWGCPTGPSRVWQKLYHDRTVVGSVVTKMKRTTVNYQGKKALIHQMINNRGRLKISVDMCKFNRISFPQ